MEKHTEETIKKPNESLSEFDEVPSHRRNKEYPRKAKTLHSERENERIQKEITIDTGLPLTIMALDERIVI